MFRFSVSLTRFSLPLAVALMVGACDRESTDAAQPGESASAASTDEKAGAISGKIDRSYAGEMMPDAQVTDPAGAKLTLAETRGQPVLMNLWATWCAPCVVEMPILDRIAAENSGRLRVLTISEDMDGQDKVKAFFAEKGLKNLPQWLDPKNDLGFAFGGGAGLPVTVLYDAQGKEVWRVMGAYDWESEEARTLIAEATAA
ncbi:TlpA family protein disulfide reductase [Croceibacterium xixiisoli]|uniref:TlpA family protein disulfide reductase n=1 Tax=Croceibacterium xixiisoli TaxID=1476466 RepID=UPI003620AADD